MSAVLKLTTPSKTEIVLTRPFPSTRDLIFDALTKPEMVKRWHSSKEWTLTVCTIDLRIDGRWRFVARGPKNLEVGYGGVYKEIIAPGLLVYTEVFDKSWYPGESVISTMLVEEAKKTTLTTSIQYQSTEARDTVLNSPMERGAAESFNRLEAFLTAEKIRRRT